ncbi:MAG: PadR family transcriptional regulator, partial [Cyanobacteria bacterium]|nr:PadR family transcriptional regulator [Cyanobacteriota bacterium]MDW8200862.1 PadR family transcriptional regulator [Cyanobacteriota bacterium SKYGB_h_bin112]
QENRPNKRIYYVTDEGSAAFQAWVAQPLPISPIKDDLLVKLFAGFSVPREVILAELDNHYRQHCQRLAIYQTIAAQFFQCPESFSEPMTFSYLTLRFGIAYEQMWLAWYHDAIVTLKTLDKPSNLLA